MSCKLIFLDLDYSTRSIFLNLHQLISLNCFKGYISLPDGWVNPFNGYQYILNETELAWKDARTSCQEMGGNLAGGIILEKFR